ncbi:MAG TPA: LptF/LptG family permease, partial [Coxiellaceae bacterium]|nr:LptF/LptG family permease [Coxiellaceae bacterium]
LHQGNFENSKGEFAYLNKGTSYRGQAGQKNYRIVQFEQSAFELSSPTQISFGDEKRASFSSLAQLWRSYDKAHANRVEFNWRLSIPACVLILALWSVPLSHLNPRQGRYAKVFYAALICLFYLNMMFASRGFAFSKKISPILGIWWIHGLMLILLVLFLIIRRGQSVPFLKLNFFKKS